MSEYIQLLHFIGTKIRSLRKERGISQEDFAFQCKLDRTYISDVELGKRNISIKNLQTITETLGVHLSDFFLDIPSHNALYENQHLIKYDVKPSFAINCGFCVLPNDVDYSARMVSIQLQKLPFSLFQSIDLKALSGMAGALFSNYLARRVGAIINPIEKGHPDIIPISGNNASEEQLRNYPEGLEIKCTVGNPKKDSNLQIGEKRLPRLATLTWQAHHREVRRLLGLIIDFAGSSFEGKQFPIITAAFYADNLEPNDWGEISGTTGRNTKVTGLLSSGKSKMGIGWIIIIDIDEYKQKYRRILSIIDT